jgi:D-alanyl-D-alanine carboxypeptidase
MFLILGLALTTACTSEPLNADSASAHAGVYKEALRRQLVEVLQDVVDATAAPGGTASAVLPDGTVITVAAGLADVASGSAITPQTRMLGGSTGKSFVGALTLRLSRQGVFELDQPVSRWLGSEPWFKRLPNAQHITIAHLASHRAGLPDHLYMPSYHEALATGSFVPPERVSPLDFVEFILDQEPLSPAGEEYHYTDTGYLLLGMVIEKATGRAYYDLVRDAFLKPLALEQTSPSDRRNIPGLATGYFDDAFTRALLGSETSRLESGLLAYNPAVEWTGGGFATSAGDLATWGKALYEGRAMRGDYLEALLGPEAAHLAGGQSTYHLGQGIRRTEQGLAYGHNGWIPGYVSFFAYYPEYGFSIAAQFNTTTDSSSPAGPIALARQRLPAAILAQLSQRER